MEQNNGEIFTNGRRATDELERLQVWQNSSAVFFVHAPDGVASVQFLVGADPVEARYEPGRRCWRVYVQPLLLARAGSFRYTVRAVDEYGNGTVLGRGTLAVAESTVAEGSAGILPANAYAYNPLTQKFHRLVATQDPETGEIVVAVNQTGESL